MMEPVTTTAPPPVVEVRRGALIESSHRAHGCVIDSRGETLMSLGDKDHVAFMRSSAKPFQAAAALIRGIAARFGLTKREIAIIAGSHGGEPFHVELVRSILAGAGLNPRNLQCGVQAPLDDEARRELRRRGVNP
ncbi:MAG TPA: hypothetical protein ENL08_01285, partial [Bacteroidetes bacterium]|nr:hypothetical protein [Bacteroidota bacterium]